MNTDWDIAERARIHAALSDPARLAIVDTLTVSDAAPGELGTALDLPTNLVAHHLNVLQQAGLVTAKTLFDKGNTDGAKAALTWVAEKASDEGYQALARLRLAGLLTVITVGLRVASTRRTSRPPVDFDEAPTTTQRLGLHT